MPYITLVRRAWLNPAINELAKLICEATRDGELNYVISRLLDLLYERRYKEMNAALGVLEAVKQEYYRRVVAPYEQKKMKENGEVYS